VVTGGITTFESRILDWTFRQRHDIIFGEVKLKSRWVELADVDDDDFLQNGWDDLHGRHVQTWIESVSDKWSVNEVRKLLVAVENFVICCSRSC
jgi:hypothetical protein